MPPGPLALTDTQLEFIRHVAAHLPVERRDRFLRAVAARLGEKPSMLAVEVCLKPRRSLRSDRRSGAAPKLHARRGAGESAMLAQRLAIAGLKDED
jgi:hypothetical protein